MIPRRDLDDMAEHRDPAERTDRIEPNEPIENAEKNDPIEPIESAEPIEPIDMKDPRLPIDRTEFSDQSDHRERAVGEAMPHSCRWMEAVLCVISRRARRHPARSICGQRPFHHREMAHGVGSRPGRLPERRRRTAPPRSGRAPRGGLAPDG